MSQLPYELLFCHRFNLHKLLGFEIDDDDLASIARIYGVPESELKAADDELRGRVKTAADKVRKDLNESSGSDTLRPVADSGEPLTYLALGDSITSDRTSYAKIIRELWGGEGVIDAGISGDTVSDLTNRFYGDVLGQDFYAVSVFIGTNDSRGLGDGSGITNTSIREYEEKLDYFLRALKKLGAAVFVITLPPAKNSDIQFFFGEESNWTYNAGHLRDMNETIRKTAEQNGAEIVDLAAEIEGSGINPLDEDGLHLNIEAQTLLAKMVLEKLIAP